MRILKVRHLCNYVISTTKAVKYQTSRNLISFSQFKACASQLPESSDPNVHFRTVCRSLVSEALEVSSFMTKVSNLETEMDDDMKEIALQDWVSLLFSLNGS